MDLAGGEVAEQTQRGLLCLLTWPVRGFLAVLLFSYGCKLTHWENL